VSNDLKIMLVDESVFDFEQQQDSLEKNAWFIKFLSDAQSDFYIIVVTEGCTATLKTKLNPAQFSEAFVEGAKIDSSFLTKDIRKWSALDLDHVDVIMADNGLSEDVPAYDLHISSGVTYNPSSFYYWMKGYESNVIFDGFLRGKKDLIASLESHNKETDNLLIQIYGDTDSVWNKIELDPDVLKLTEIFSAVERQLGEPQSAEERATECLYGYFNYTVRQQYAPDISENIEGNLQAYREGLMQAFKEFNISEQANLANKALTAIERIVQSEPTKLQIQ
jgi:hypothetical protein